MKNSILIKRFLVDMIKEGANITSRDYFMIVLKDIFNNKMEKYFFLKYIEISYDIIEINEHIDDFGEEVIGRPLNEIYNELFIPTTKKSFKKNISNDMYLLYERIGIKL
ncbi:hypothetical protein C0585_03560 [Candidatus Woesearchaeota archaeon]|nr:MAG: hypothetical protein C0585_03560 [Candidatus Woesearchaeota archaeon]